jgi:hypothetical protein
VVVIGTVFSTCGDLNISYEWEFNSGEPSTPELDYNSIMSTGSYPNILTIEPNQLVSGIVYKFTIHATEEGNSVEGKDEFFLTVESTPLVIKVDREDG